MIKRFFIFAFLFVLSGCGSTSILKLAGAVESLNKDLVEANKVIAKSTDTINILIYVKEKEAKRKAKNDAKKEAEKKAKEEAEKNRSWLQKFANLG